MIDPGSVSAVLVTRGDQPLDEIVDSLTDAGIDDAIVWDNARRGRDVSCYGRYLAIAEATNEWILFQDDDLIAPVAELLACYRPDADQGAIVANNRVDEEWPLIGIGSVFHRDLADCFQPYIDAYGEDEDFHRVCDVVFGYSNPYRRVVLGYRDLPWASAPGSSMYLEEGHMHYRLRARERILALRQSVPAA